MRPVYAIFSLLGALLWAEAPLADDGPLGRVRDGVAAYREDGPRAAISAWVAGSPLDGDKSALSLANQLAQIDDFYGKVIDFSVRKTYKTSPRSQILFLVIHYEKGALYSRFELYLNGSGDWVVPTFDVNTKIAKVWPDRVIYDY